MKRILLHSDSILRGLQGKKEFDSLWEILMSSELEFQGYITYKELEKLHASLDATCSNSDSLISYFLKVLKPCISNNTIQRIPFDYIITDNYQDYDRTSSITLSIDQFLQRYQLENILTIPYAKEEYGSLFDLGDSGGDSFKNGSNEAERYQLENMLTIPYAKEEYGSLFDLGDSEGDSLKNGSNEAERYQLENMLEISSAKEEYRFLFDLGDGGINPFWCDIGINPFSSDIGINPFWCDIGINPFSSDIGINPFWSDIGINF
jgi:hypothetical protein